MRLKPLFISMSCSFLLCFILNFILMKISIPFRDINYYDFLIHRPFWSGTLVLYLIFNVFFVLKKSWYWTISTFLFLFLTGFGFANFIKMEKRSDPIIPSDIYLLKESWVMAKQYVSTMQIVFFISGIIAFIFVAIFLFKKKWQPSVSVRIRFVISLVCLVGLVFIFSIKDNEIWNKFGVSNQIVSAKQNLLDNGFVMGNVLQFSMLYQQKPENYNKSQTEAYIAQLEKSVENNYEKFATTDAEQMPNLIVILMEAFFDPTTLPDVTFSQDPIPFFHSLQQKYTHGKLSVNAFGAGTANTEFEIFTSMNTQLFPYPTHPYTSHVTHPVDSIAHRLQKYGYATSGLHNSHRWFYQREKVWPHLGIDYMEFADDIFKDKNVKHVYDVPAVPKDVELFKKVFKRTARTKGRDFVKAVTMELHGPYTLWEAHEIKVTSDKISQKSKEILEEYAYKIREADKALELLINYYQSSDEPTMIVMYGDHLPWLGDDQLVYLETGYNDQSSTLENHDRMHMTPFLIWDNYRNSEKVELNLGTTFLMPYVFQQIGIKGNGLHNFHIEKLKRGIYRLPPKGYYEQEGWAASELENYKHLQYYYLQQPTAADK